MMAFAIRLASASPALWVTNPTMPLRFRIVFSQSRMRDTNTSSSSVTIPAGQQTSVSVTLQGTRPNPGIYEGAIQVTGAGPALRDALARMEQRLRNTAVVGQQHQPFAVEIEPPDRKHTHPDAAQKIGDRRTAGRIAHRGDDVLRLIQHHKGLRRCRLDVAAVHFDMVLCRIDFHPHFAHNRPIDRHAALRDQFLRLAARGQTGIGDHFLQPNVHLRQ